MRLQDGTILGGPVWEQSRLGELGWCMGIAVAPDGEQLIQWTDVTATAYKRVADDEWQYLIAPGRVPIDLTNTRYGDVGAGPGEVTGGYHAAFASNQVAYAVQYDRVIVSTNIDTAGTFVNTQLIGKEVNPNPNKEMRSYAQKGATDFSNPDVYYIFMGPFGFHYTLNGTTGADFTKPSWLPNPTFFENPGSYAFGIVAVNNQSAMTGGATSRRSQLLLAPSSQGLWLSNDGGLSGTKISTASGPGKIDTISSAVWIANKLYVTVVGKDNVYYGMTESAATGGSGETQVGAYFPGKCDNLRVYDPAASGEKWSIVAHGAETRGANDYIKFITPRPGGGYFAWFAGGDAMYTINGTNFIYIIGGGYVDPATGLAINTLRLTKTRHRPAVADRFRSFGTGSAVSLPVIAGSWLYYPNGLGPVRTLHANWPTISASYGDDPLDATRLPLWEEDTAGYEAKVGQTVKFIGDELTLGGQDVAGSRYEDGRRGHFASVYTYPAEASLSDNHGMAAGPIPGFGVMARRRSGQKARSGFSFTLNSGVTWQLAPMQPPSANPYDPVKEDGNPYISGGAMCGSNYSAIDIPSKAGLLQPGEPGYVYKPLVPHGTPDVRSQPWVPLRLFKDGVQIDMDWDEKTKHNGMQGGSMGNIHELACYDADEDRYYLMHLGSGTSENDGTNWVYDTPGNGGIYRTNPGEWRDFHRVFVGSPVRYGNSGFFDVRIQSAGDFLIMSGTFLTGKSNGRDGNPIVVIDKRDWSKRLITWPGNATSICLGDPAPGDTMPTAWAIAWSQTNQFALWYSRDWWVANPTFHGPYDLPKYGFPNNLEAKRTLAGEPREWGRLAIALQTRGHAIGRWSYAA